MIQDILTFVTEKVTYLSKRGSFKKSCILYPVSHIFHKFQFTALMITDGLIFNYVLIGLNQLKKYLAEDMRYKIQDTRYSLNGAFPKLQFVFHVKKFEYLVSRILYLISTKAPHC